MKFVAIDCFYHAGSCRKTYQLNYFPHMMLYIRASRAYQYFGPASLSNLIEFIEMIRYPVIKLTNDDEFYDFILQHEVKFQRSNLSITSLLVRLVEYFSSFRFFRRFTKTFLFDLRSNSVETHRIR